MTSLARATRKSRASHASRRPPASTPSCFEGISLRYTQANISNIMIKGCVFADIRQPYSSYQPSESGWARAIAIEGEPVRAG